jgi:citrate synthase
MSDNFGQVVNTAIWQELPEEGNPFAAAVCRLRGYDVYGDLLGKAGYLEYLWLLFKGERPAAPVLAALNVLAVALANPGPRDPSVHAAMATGATGTPAASSLLSALAVGAGGSGGAREVLLAMQSWEACGNDLGAWTARLATPLENRPKFWPETGHPPGFDPHSAIAPRTVAQLADALLAHLPDGRLAWLRAHRAELEAAAGTALNQLGVVAAAFADLGLAPAEGEMLTLLWRLPGAAAHALEQQRRGFRQFPFFELELESDPGPIAPQEPRA